LLLPAERVAWRLKSPRRRTAAFLVGFSLAYVAVLCANPLLYERYFLLVSPALTAAFLLDSFTLVEGLPGRLGRWAPRGTRWLVVAALMTLLFAARGARLDDLRGRIDEIAYPLVGPVDRVVAHLSERYEQPEELIIATNYEAHPLMFYLGSHVIVGYSLNNIEVDRKLVPDVVIPRRHWVGTLRVLNAFLRRGRYETVLLPAPDIPYNNIPALSRMPGVPLTHRFLTPVSADSRGYIRVHHRLPAASG
jgi:hypothetical protein